MIYVENGRYELVEDVTARFVTVGWEEPEPEAPGPHLWIDIGRMQAFLWEGDEWKLASSVVFHEIQ